MHSTQHNTERMKTERKRRREERGGRLSAADTERQIEKKGDSKNLYIPSV